MILGDEIYLLEFEGRIGCFRIVVFEIVFILFKMEIVIKGKVVVLENEEMYLDVGVVELVEMFLSFGRGLVGRIVVKGSFIVLVRFFNLFDNNVIIYIGIMVG